MKTDADKLRSFLRQVAPTIKTYGKKSVISKVDKAITATEDSTAVLFCGEFKTGKSSLVNAIIGTELCPTDIGIATSVVTMIKYGTAKKAVRYYGNLLENADSLKSEEIEWNDIEKYTVGDVLGIDNTILVELSYPSPFLKNGVVIIDTPGIGGLDPRHAILTHMVLPKADVIVFITDASEPLTQSEFVFYKNKILPCERRNIVLVNKSDILTADTLTAHINNVKYQLAKLGSPEIISVSAKYWNLFSKSGDNDFLISSNKDAVLASLTSVVESFKKDQYKKCRDMVVTELNDALTTISLEIQQLEKDSSDKAKTIEDLQRQQAALSKFRSDLNNPVSQIRLQINSIFEDARNEVQNLISHDGTLLTTTEFDTLLECEHGLENEGKWLVAQINDRLQKLSRKVDSRIDCAFDEITQGIGKEITNVMEAETFQVSDELKSCSVINSQLAFSLAGKVMTGTLIGGLTTAAVGLLIPGLGLIAGIATAAALIWKQVSRETQQQKRVSLRQQVLPKINLAITDIKNQANTRFTKFHQNLLSTLQTIIQETEDKMRELQTTIQESRDNDHQRKDKIAELEQKVKFCDTMISQMKLLYSNPFSNVQ